MTALMFTGNASAAGTLHNYSAFPSSYVIPRDVSVWTPPGYDPKGPPLAVIYMQDGENLYEPSHSLSHADWQVDRTLSRLIAQRSIPPVIVVGIASTGLRGREYLPQKIFARLPANTREIIEKSWNGPPLSDRYLRFMVDELKPFVDAHFHTRHDAAGTFAIGSSMGGLISLYAQTEYPKVFGGSASLSMHWLLGSPQVMTGIGDQRALAKTILSAFDGYLSNRALNPSHNRIYVDHGDSTLDAFYAPYTHAFEAQMQRLGWRNGKDIEFLTFPGAAHSERDWAKRLATPVEFLLN